MIYNQLHTTKKLNHPGLFVLSAGAVEYTDCRGLRTPPNKYPGYGTKQSDGEISVMLGLWGMRSTPSLPLFLGPLWSGVVAPDRALSVG